MRCHRHLGLAALTAALALGGCASAIGEPEAGPDAGGDDEKTDELPEADAAPPEPQPVTLSHSASTDITDLASLRCYYDNGTDDESDDYHSDNSYYRVFDLPEMGVEGELEVEGVTIGIQEANSHGDGSQPASVRLYTLEGALRVENLTQIGGVDIQIADQNLQLLEIPVTATVPAGSVLVLELFTPIDDEDDGDEVHHTLWLGANAAGQSAPSYILARDCAFQEPLDVAAIVVDNDNDGSPDFDTSLVHYVMSVSGTALPPQ